MGVIGQLINSFNLLRHLKKRFSKRVKGNLSIAPTAWISGSAAFDFDGDGYELGGEIIVHRGARICAGAIASPYGGRIVIHENVFIGPYCVLYGHGGLEIQKNSMVAAHSVIVASTHCHDRVDVPVREQGFCNRGILIGEDVWIGAGAKILDGVTIEKGSIVGAGAVVTKSLKAYSIAVGVPAKVILNRKR